MRRRVVLALAILAFLSLAVRPALCQYRRAYFVTAGAGYSKLFEFTIKSDMSEIGDAKNSTPDGSVAINAAVFYNASPRLAIGGELGWLDFGGPSADGVDDSYSAVSITGQVMHMFPTNRTTIPFLIGGAGLYRLRNDVGGETGIKTTDNVFGINVGAGLKVETKSPVSYGVEARFHLGVNPKLLRDSDTGIREFDVSDWKMLSVTGRVFF